MSAEQLELIKLLSIPLVAGLVGWGTNWVAIQLTFYPIRFIGVRPIFGWQGIVPRKARKIAALAVGSITAKLGSLTDIFERLDPPLLAEQIDHYLSPRIEEYVDKVAAAQPDLQWQRLPITVRQPIYDRVRNQLPNITDSLMADITQHVEELINLNEMVLDELAQNKKLLNRLFLDCGAREFTFIIRSGFYFGLPLGLIQMLIWWQYPLWWILPFFGFLVGYATNWIAINCVFRPLEPKPVGPFTIQGLFLKRQQEVAEIWCGIVTSEVLNLPNLIKAMLHGPQSARTHKLIDSHMRKAIDEVVGLARPALQLTIGRKRMAQIPHSMASEALAIGTAPFSNADFNQSREREIETLILERMADLSSTEFQDLLRPAFQEDEILLILVGAVLGCAAGFAQLFLVFGGWS